MVLLELKGDHKKWVFIIIVFMHCQEMLRAGMAWVWREAVLALLCGFHLTGEEHKANLCPGKVVLEGSAISVHSHVF